jgi:hypothetical protein
MSRALGRSPAFAAADNDSTPINDHATHLNTLRVGPRQVPDFKRDKKIVLNINA